MAAQLLARAAAAQPEAIDVMPENWGAMRLFLAMETQWRRAGMSGLAFQCGTTLRVVNSARGGIGTEAVERRAAR